MAVVSQQARLVGAFCLFGLAYTLLPFGLLLPLFRMKVTVFGITMTDEALSTFQTIHKLGSQHHMVPATLIVFFSVLVPLVKLVMVLVQSRRAAGDSVDHWLVALLRSTARWATVDAFVAVLLSTVFVNAPDVDITLKAGFYAFLAYCLVAVIASQALPAEPGLSQSTPGSVPTEGGRRTGLVLLGLSAMFLVVGLKWPCFVVDVPTLGLSQEIAVAAMPKTGPVLVLCVLVGLVPFVEMGLALADHSAAGVVADWAMGDVLAVAVLVALLLLKALPDTSAALLPGFWCLALHAAFLFLARRSLRHADKGPGLLPSTSKRT